MRDPRTAWRLPCASAAPCSLKTASSTKRPFWSAQSTRTTRNRKSSASATSSTTWTPATSCPRRGAPPARLQLLVAERDDRVELARLVRRVHAEEHADTGREEERHRNSPRRDDGRHGRPLADGGRAAPPERNAHEAAQNRE